MSTAVMRATFALLAALAIGILVASAWAGPSLDKCIRRCEKLYFDEPTPAMPTPRPTPNCSDGYLTTPASKTDPWYGITVDIPEGVTKHFCAPIRPPLINFHPKQIVFSWYDVSDQDCAAISVRVDAYDPPSRPRGGGGGWSASGSYYYLGQVGTRQTPEQTAPGVYMITLVGGPSSCTRYRIAWKAQ